MVRAGAARAGAGAAERAAGDSAAAGAPFNLHDQQVVRRGGVGKCASEGG